MLRRLKQMIGQALGIYGNYAGEINIFQVKNCEPIR